MANISPVVHGHGLLMREYVGNYILNYKKDSMTTLNPLVSLTLTVAYPKIADTDRTRLSQEDGDMSKSKLRVSMPLHSPYNTHRYNPLYSV